MARPVKVHPRTDASVKQFLADSSSSCNMDRNKDILFPGDIQRSPVFYGVLKKKCEKNVNCKNHVEDLDVFSLLKVCAKKKDLIQGITVHEDIMDKDLLENNFYLASSLINMYIKCGALTRAELVHEELLFRNRVTWNALIAGYNQHGHGYKAIVCFERMKCEGLSPCGVTYCCILKACGSMRDIDKGKQIHEEIMTTSLLGKDIVLDSALVSMYAKCGALAKAQEVFEDLSIRSVVTWSALISGYLQHGQSHEALSCFEYMQNEGHHPNEVTFICALRACGNTGDINKGNQIHSEIASRGFIDKDIVLGNALLDMYAKCGTLTRAAQLFDELAFRNVVSWNTIITGYVQQDQAHRALNYYEQMQKEGLSPDIVTFISVLKACGRVGALTKGIIIHEKITENDLLKKNISLGTALVDMYARCNELTKARQVLEELSTRDIVSWNVLILGFAEEGQLNDALNCFEQLQTEGLIPDVITFVSVLKVAGSTKSLEQGKKIHDEIVNRGLVNGDNILCNALIDMYAKCGMLSEAQKLLEELPLRDVVSWSALISGYVQEGHAQEAINCVKLMQDDGLSPNGVTFICLLKACGIIRDLNKGKEMHEDIVRRGFLEDIVIGFALVDMYAKCGQHRKARELLDELPVQNVALWSTLISECAEWGKIDEALNYYEWMQNEGLLLDVPAFACILKTCGNIGAINMGKQVHSKILSTGLLEKSPVLGTALMDMYAKFGMLAKAQELLDDLHVQDAISWNAIIAGYTQWGLCDEALRSYDRMCSEGVLPDVVTFSCILKSCGQIGGTDKGKQIHNEVLCRGLHVMVAAALTSMYCKLGLLSKAQHVLEGHHMRDAISWNALIAGYCQHGRHQEALDCFDRMQDVGLSPDEVSFACLLYVCGNAGCTEKGKQIHNEIVRRNMLGRDVVLDSSLVDMYAKCGMLEQAQEVIEKLPVRDIVPWNALIAGYAKQGQGHKALRCYRQMQNDHLIPDKITFISVLSACSHSGLSDEAEIIFDDMIRKYATATSFKHHVNMVVVYGSAGHFDNAISVIMAMPSSFRCEVWHALLSVCRKWGNVKLGMLAFDQTMQLDNWCRAVSPYVKMGNNFTTFVMPLNAEHIEKIGKT